MNRRMEMPAYKAPLVMTEAPIPQPPLKGLVLKVQYAGICHSDLHIDYDDIMPPNIMEPPRVLGHEISGEVYALGADAKCDMKVGDRAVLYPWIHCGECYKCKNDNTFCPLLLTIDPKEPAPTSYGVFRDGGFQNYVEVHDASYVFPVPDTVPMEVACLVPCSGITAYTAVRSIETKILETIKMKGDATVVLLGAGGLCQWAIQFCKILLPPKVKVCVVDINDEKLKDAKELGVDMTVCWPRESEKNLEAIGALLGAGGQFNAAIDFTGYTDNLFRLLAASDMNATITLVGLGGTGDLSDFPLRVFIIKGIQLQGLYVGSKASLSEVMDMLDKGKVSPPLIEVVKLDQVNAVFDKLRNGTQKGRAVIKMA